jgi:hypothetical protein
MTADAREAARLAVAKAVCGYTGGLFEELHPDRTELCHAVRTGSANINDMTQADALDMADAALAALAPHQATAIERAVADAVAGERERCAKVADSLADDRSGIFSVAVVARRETAQGIAATIRAGLPGDAGAACAHHNPATSESFEGPFRVTRCDQCGGLASSANFDDRGF